MKIISKLNKEIVALGFLIFLGLVFRLYLWSHLGLNTLSWDESAHSLAGLALAKTALHGFAPAYLIKFFNNYWAATGSLFFYPYGYTALSALSFLFFGFNQLAARIPGMGFSILIIFAVYLLAKKMFGKNAALLAAFFAAINSAFIIWGGQAMVDLPMACLMIFSIYFCLQALSTGKMPYWLLAGVFAGLAGLMKPPGFIVYPFLAFLVASFQGLKSLFKKPFVGLTAVVFLFFFSYFGLGLLAFFVLSKLGIISEATGLHIFKAIFHWFSNSLTYAEAIDPSYKTLAGWWFYLKILPSQLGGWPVLILGFLGVLKLWRDKNRNNFYLVAGYIIFIYLAFTFLNNKDTRYTIPYLPFFCLLAALGLDFFTSLFKKNQVIYILPAMLFLTGAVAFNNLAAFGKINASDIGLESAVKIITQSKPGLVVAAKESNGLNVQSLSFYLAINDPELQYSVYWPDKFNEADYAIASHAEDVNLPGAKLIFSSKNIYLFEVTKK